MELAQYYIKYLQELGEGRREAPEGITLSQTDPMRRAVELQEAIAKLGVPEFVRRCAAQDGLTLPPELLEGYRPEELAQALCQFAEEQPSPSAEEAEEAVEAAEEAAEEAQTPKIEEPDGPRSAYEVLLDCCLLDEKLLYYLIDVTKRSAVEEFQKLALVTTRNAFTPDDLLRWFAGKERRGTQEELICVTLMDTIFERLAAEGQKELIAALLCGDRTTFELFRCDAPELVHLPEATYKWYEKNYLAGYYPVRYMLKFNGVAFPADAAAEE